MSIYIFLFQSIRPHYHKSSWFLFYPATYSFEIRSFRALCLPSLHLIFISLEWDLLIYRRMSQLSCTSVSRSGERLQRGREGGGGKWPGEIGEGGEVKERLCEAQWEREREREREWERDSPCQSETRLPTQRLPPRVYVPHLAEAELASMQQHHLRLQVELRRLLGLR